MTAVLLLATLAAIEVGDRAPPVAGVSGDLSGHVTLVVFFATWCKPCHRAFPELAVMQQALGGRVQMVLVEAGEPPDEVRLFLAPMLLGGRSARDPLEGEGVERIAEAISALTLDCESVGEDMLISARLREW